jgi:O-antigen/teichoic acid export membrane protein
MVFFLSQIVAVARIRQFAGSDRTAARTSVAGTLFITLALGVSASVGMVACGPFLFPLVFGTDFSIAPLAALYIGTAVTLTALVGVLIQFQIAVGHQRAAAGWAGSAVFVLAVLVLQPHNEAGIGLALLAAAAVAMVLGFLPFRRSFQRPDGGTTVPPYDPTEEDERTDARLSVQLEGLSTPRGGGS